MTPTVLVLELNELCTPLLDRFMAEGLLPNVARLRAESARFTTDAEETGDRLQPWVQWVTAHTGVGLAEHGAFKLGEGSVNTCPTVADVVGEAGGDVWLCGPMNVVPTRAVCGRWLPDPWNPDATLVPPDLAPFADFVRANVQEHTNERHRLSARSYVDFLAFMARHGLSPATVAEVGRQLGGERVGRRSRWQRTALLDRFQWDVFRREWKRNRPQFATYFSNTAAHYQHLYWRHLDPDAFPLRPDDAEIATYGPAVRSGYQEADRLVGDALDLVGDEGTLVFCTALGQAPFTDGDDDGGSRFYRPYDVVAFVKALGLPAPEHTSPVMSEQFHLFFTVEADADAAAAALAAATVDGESAFTVRQAGCDVFSGFNLVSDLATDAEIEVPATGARVRVHEYLYRAETSRSGSHVPEGVLWIRTPGGVTGERSEPVPLRSLAPTLLHLMGLAPTSSMTAPILPVGQPVPA